MVNRFSVVCRSKRDPGALVHVFGNRSWYIFDTLGEAKKELELYQEQLKIKLGFKELYVLEVECWDDGEAVGALYSIEKYSHMIRFRYEN